MSLKIKLYTLEQDDSQPTFFGHVLIEEGDCYNILRSSLKKKSLTSHFISSMLRRSYRSE